MDLIERYLAAIGRHLPAKQAADITAELRDLLLSRVEDREAELRRPLTQAELEALLTDFGNPLAVAWRYRKVQQLIGPEIFPFWWQAVKIMLLVVLGVYVVLVAIAGVVGETAAEFKRSVPDISTVAVYWFGMVTLVCAGIELAGKTQVLTKWRPSRLPPAGVKPRSRFEATVEGVMSCLVILWWVGLIHISDVLPFPGSLTVDLAPVWTTYHWPILAYLVFDVVANAMAVVRPGNVRLNAAVSIGRYAVGAVIFLGLLQAGHWVVVAGPQAPQVLAGIQRNFDIGMRFGVWGGLAVLLGKAAAEAWRFYKARRVAGLAPA